MACTQITILLLSLAAAFVSADVGIKANITKRSPFPQEGVTLGFVMREIGMLECQGIDHITGGHFFEKLLGGNGADVGGNYLCLPTCGGECIPNQDIGVAPISAYPFGCKCAMDRCNEEGPLTTKLSNGIFKIICEQDSRCTCDGMGPQHHVGYLCNWINLNSHRPVSIPDPPSSLPFLRPDLHVHTTYSPIRWCSCCPKDPLPMAY